MKFSMDAADRVAGRKCSATFSFVTATPLPEGGSISLVYPSELFVFFIPLDSSTRVEVSDVPQALLGVSVRLDNPSPGASTTATISFTPVYVYNFNRLVITLTGFKCVPGQSTLVSSFGGIDENPAAVSTLTSDGVLTVSFSAGKLSAGRLASFAVSNIQNPSFTGFFPVTNIRAATYGAASPTLRAYVGSSVTVRRIIFEKENTLVLDGVSSAISAGAVDVQLVDVIIGAPMPSSNQINVATSQDHASSISASSGPIYGKVRKLRFFIESSARVAFNSNVVAVYSFSTESFIPNGGNLQFCHPSGFFQTDNRNLRFSFGNCSSCIQWISSSCLLTTLSASSMPAGSQTVSISGLVLGKATPGGPVFVRSSADYASDYVASGSIGGRMSDLSFFMSDSERVPRARNSSATISFVTASAVTGAFTLSFPQNFFDVSTLPSAFASFQSKRIEVIFVSSSSMIFTADSLVPSGSIVITLFGLATGPPTSGGPINIASSTDLPVTVDSGSLGAFVTTVQEILVTSATADTLTVQFSAYCLPQSCAYAAPIFSLKWDSTQANINLQESCSPSVLLTAFDSLAIFNATCPTPGYSASTYTTLVLVKDSLGIAQDIVAGPFNTSIASFATSDSGISSTCLICPAGTIASVACPSSLSSCRACPSGSYSSRAGSDVCWRCPSGYFSDKRGATECSICGPGLFSNAAGAASCSVCPAGTRSQFQFGSTMCLQCVSGTFSPEKSSSCAVCGVGHYSSTPGSSMCFPCSSNTFSDVVGAVSESQCRSCPAGTMSSIGAGFCTDCQPGTFRPFQSAFGCLDCPASLFSPAKASECSTCKLGGYNIHKNSRGLTCTPPLFISNTITRSRNVTVAVTLAAVDAPTRPISGIIINNLPVSSPGNLQAACSGIVALPTTAQINSDNGQVTITWNQPVLLTANFYLRCQVIGFENSVIPSSRAVSASITLATRQIMDFPLGDVNIFQSSLTRVSLTSSSNISAAMTTITVAFRPSNASLPIKMLKLGNVSFSYSMISNPDGFLCRQQLSENATWMPLASSVSIAVDPSADFQASFQFSPSLRASAPSVQIRCEFPGIVNGNSSPGHPFMTIATFQDVGTDIVAPLDVAYNVPFPVILDPPVLTAISDDSSLPIACQPGNFLFFSTADLSTSCLPCPQGTFSVAKDSASCTPCSAGLFSSVNRSSSSQACQLCPAGSYCISGSILPTPCPLGQYSLAGSSRCIPCQQGYFSAVLGAASPSSCQACPSGSYASSTGLSSCSRCSYGEFSDKIASIMCEKCPVGLYTQSEGSSSFIDCKPCPAGTFWSQGNCAPCAPGTYNPNVGSMDSSTCLLCPPGHISRFGSSTCTACSAGSIAPVAGSATCTFCPLGSYSLSANFQCTLCPSNTFSVNAPALGISTCSPCASDSFSSQGSSSCSALLCSPGTARLKLGSSPAVCSLCPAGSFSPSSNSLSCTTCRAGTFASQAGSSICQNCVPGTFSTAGSLLCSACPLGFVSATDSSSCTPCPAGTYEMNKVCVACPPNFFSEAGSSSCTWCGSGSISTLGSAMCFKCDAGSYWLPGDPSSLLQPSSSRENADSGLWSSGSLRIGRNGLAATSLPSQNLAFFAGGYGIHGNIFV